MSFSMCRVCLVGNSRLLNIVNQHLEMFEKLTNTTRNDEADIRMPRTICYICYRQLQKCHRFSIRAQKSNMILRQLLRDTDEESPPTFILPSQEIMHHLVVTPMQHTSLNICSNTANISPITVKEEQIAMQVEKANINTDDICSNTANISPITVKEEQIAVQVEKANRNTDDEELNEDVEKSNIFNKTQPTFILPSQEIMHHLVVTPMQHTPRNICSNTANISPIIVKEEQIAVQVEKANINTNDICSNTANISPITVKEEQIAVQVEKANINTDDICSNTANISPITVKEEQIAVQVEKANNDTDDVALNEDVEKSYIFNKMEPGSMSLCFYDDVCYNHTATESLHEYFSTQQSQWSQNMIIDTDQHQDQLNTRHTVNVKVNNNKKERQKRYREQNREKLKQRERERKNRIRHLQSTAGPSSMSILEVNNKEKMTCSYFLQKKESQQRYRKRNRDKLKQREAERRRLKNAEMVKELSTSPNIESTEIIIKENNKKN